MLGESGMKGLRVWFARPWELLEREEFEGVSATRISPVWFKGRGGAGNGTLLSIPEKEKALVRVDEGVCGVATLSAFDFRSSDKGMLNVVVFATNSFSASSGGSGPANESWEAGDGDLLLRGRLVSRTGFARNGSALF